MGSGEFGFIERLRGRLSTTPKPTEIHVGDDAAVLLPPGQGFRLLVATDLVVEGVHFDLSLGSLADAGWKSLAVNVSDIAAMGGRARHAVAAVGAPPGTDLDRLADGLLEAAEEYAVALVGGDLSEAEQVVVAVTMLGDCPPNRVPVSRGGARPGDGIWVTGPLGASAAGLRELRARSASGASGAGVSSAYLRPVARVPEGELAADAGVTAMIDVSDGLTADLAHICEGSGVGARLDDVPVAPGATEAEALGGGEDYELLFTAPAGSEVAERFGDAGLRMPICIGTCTDAAGELSLRGAPIQPSGWEHRFER